MLPWRDGEIDGQSQVLAPAGTKGRDSPRCSGQSAGKTFRKHTLSKTNMNALFFFFFLKKAVVGFASRANGFSFLFPCKLPSLLEGRICSRQGWAKGLGTETGP